MWAHGTHTRSGQTVLTQHDQHPEGPDTVAVDTVRDGIQFPFSWIQLRRFFSHVSFPNLVGRAHLHLPTAGLL